MFSKDPAALLGFRDSFVFMKKNPKLVKVHITDDEKGYLVQRNQMRSTFRTREISVVTARSVFKQFGHRVVKKGRKGRDDYYYTGEEEGESDENSADEGKDLSKDPWSPIVSSRNNLTNRKLTKDVAPVVNEVNWLHHVAMSIRNFNTQICEYRRDNPSFYDINTRVHQIPSARQPLRLLNEIKEKQATLEDKDGEQKQAVTVESGDAAAQQRQSAGSSTTVAANGAGGARSAPTNSVSSVPAVSASAPGMAAATTVPTSTMTAATAAMTSTPMQASATPINTSAAAAAAASMPSGIPQNPLQQAQMRPGNPFAMQHFQQQQQQMALYVCGNWF